MKSDQLFAAAGALLAGASVIIGAFGAHALKARISTDLFGVFEIGARYHMYHALALFDVAWACSRQPGPFFVLAGWLFIAGVGLFSGSLYMLALTGAKWFGAVTPVGGVFFVAGWLAFFAGLLKLGR
jgi:uncharacterized membrane protein YgdD (TMEM256/DUF423 family)